MRLYIKNMVCVRCATMVNLVLDKLGLKARLIKSGEIELDDQLSESDLNKLNAALVELGLGLLEEKKSVLIEKIRNNIIDMVHYKEEKPKVNLSDYLKEQIGFEYSYLSKIFSETKGTTIEHFYIEQRIERSKEMLIHEDVSIKEISYRLNFSSGAHFCNQFKKSTGLTATKFKKIMSSRNDN